MQELNRQAALGAGLPRSRFRTPTVRESGRRLVWTLGVCVVIALMFPFPGTKLVLGGILGFLYLKYLSADMALGLALVAFAVPVQDMTPREVMLFPGANIGTAVLLLLLLFWWKHELQRPRDAAPRPPFRLGLAQGCFAVAGLVAIVQSWLFQGDSLSYLLILFKDQFAFMLLAVVAYRTLTKPEQRWLVFATIVCVDILVAAQSVQSYGAGVRERSAGLIAGQPNLYGGFLAMQIPFLVALFVSKEITQRVRIIIGVLLVVVLQALVLTGSRGAWVAAAIGMAVLALVANRRAIPVLIVGYLLMPALFYGFSEERYQSLTRIVGQAPELEEDPDDSFEYRMNVWSNLGKLVGPPYVWGRGFATSDNAMQQAGLLDERKSTHSGIVTLAVEMGAVGVALYVWLLVVLWRTARKHLKVARDGLGAILAAGFIGAIPALIVCDVSGTRFQNGEVMAYFWLLSGLLLREAADREAADVPGTSLLRAGRSRGSASPSAVRRAPVSA